MIRSAFALALALTLFVVTGAFGAGPGGGTAVISPPGVVPAGQVGTWTITYTADDQFNDGTVVVSVPSGWTPPQVGDPAAPGYVTVGTDAPTGNPVATTNGDDIQVEVDTLDVGLTLTIVYGDDSAGANPDALAKAGTSVGPSQFLVASHTTSSAVGPILSSPAVDIVAAAPFALRIAPDDTTATAGDFVEYTVYVEDEFDNRTPVTQTRTLSLFPASGQFFLTDQSTVINFIDIPVGQDSVRIDYKGSVATYGSPHNLTIFTTDGFSPSLFGNTFVSIDPGPVSANVSLIGASSPVVADGSAQSTVSVTSRDGFGNVRPGDTVTISATGSAVETQPGAPTDAAGQATGVLTNTTAEAVTVSATVDGQLLANTVPVQFVAGPVSAATSTVDATTPVVADGSTTSTITVTARDAEGNPIQGADVVLAVDPTASTSLTQPGGQTNASGQVTGFLSSTVAGDRTVTATINAVSILDDALVTFESGVITSFEWTVDGAAVAGVGESATLAARDEQGNVVTGFTGTVDLTSTSGDGAGVSWANLSGNGTLTPGAPGEAAYAFAAADSGIVTLQVQNETAESFQLTADDQGSAATGTSSSIAVAPNTADEVAVVSGDGQIATAGAIVGTPVLFRVTDAFGNPVAGETIAFSIQQGGGSIDVVAGGGAQTSGATNSSGELDVDEWTLGTTAGPNQLRATISASGAGTPTADASATGVAGPGANLVITPPSGSITVGTAQAVTARLTDANDNPVQGERVDIFIKSPADGTLSNDISNPSTSLGPTARFDNTDTDGEIVVTYNAPAGAGLSDSVDALSSTVDATDAVYTTVASGATNLRITFTGGATHPAGASFEFLVEAVDGGGNVDTGVSGTVDLTPESGSGLLFSASDFGTPVTQATLSSGAATIYGLGETAGNWDITASGLGLTAGVGTVTVNSTGVIDRYAVTAAPSATAGAAFSVTIEAQDEFGNRVTSAGNIVDLLAVDAADSTQPATGTLQVAQATLSAGMVGVGETYTVAEDIRIRASDASSNVGFSGTVTVVPAGAAKIVEISGDATGVVAGANQSLIAEVRDPFGNPVQGVPVSFAVLEGGGSVSAAPADTDVNGRVTRTLTTGTTVGTNRVRAQINDANPPEDETVEYVVQTIAGPIDYYTVTPGATSFTVGQNIGLTVEAFDQNDNKVVLDNSTNIDLTTSGTRVAFGATSGTLTGGEFVTTVTDSAAETFSVTAQTQGGGPSGTSVDITANNGPAYQIVKISGDASGVTVGASQPLLVEVRDTFGNPVPGVTVPFQITSAPDGTASLTDTVFDPNDGITTTQSDGRATVTLNTATAAGDNDVRATILDGNPTNLERVSFRVSTVAGGIDRYEVLTSHTQRTAGQAATITVRALDASDNLVNDNSTTVVLSTVPAATPVPIWGANPAVLQAGTLQTTVEIQEVGSFQVRAETQGTPSVNGLSPAIAVSPGTPAGAITANAVPSAITANGNRTSTITSGVITDQFGNQVATGEYITIATDAGSFDTPDQDTGTGGNQQAVRTNGTIEFVLRSDTTPGTATVTMNSVNGSASGSVQVEFTEVPAFVCDTPPSPGVATIGDTLTFIVDVENTSLSAATLNASTTFQFTDGTRTFSAPLAAPTPVPAGNTVQLTFAATVLDTDFVPGFYQPTVTLIGTDGNNTPFSIPCVLPAQSLVVSAVQIAAITAPAQVPVGQTDTVRVEIDNLSPVSATVTNVDLTFTPSGNFTELPSPDLNLTIPAGATRTARVPVTVGAGTSLGTYSIDAKVEGTVNGESFIDPSVAPASQAQWEVIQSASLAYVPGTLSPAVVSQGQAQAFSVQIENNGAATVTLNTSTTISFGAGPSYTAQLASGTAIAGGATQTLSFVASAVPALTGLQAVSVDAQGTENGGSFQQLDINCGQVSVQVPSSITVAPGNPLLPDTVSNGTSPTFTFALENAGGATVVLTPALTTLSFAGYTATLDPNGDTQIEPGANTLTFIAAGVGESAGTYPADVHLEGTENGIAITPLDFNAADDVTVEDAPDLLITRITPKPLSTFTADQNPAAPSGTRDIVVVVENNGGSSVTFTQAQINFSLGPDDRTSQFSITPPTEFETGGATLAGGATDSVVFTVEDNTGNAMSTGLMTIEGLVEAVDNNSSQTVFTSDLSAKGSLLVQSPANLQILDIISERATVTAGMTDDFIVRMPVRNNGQSEVLVQLNNTDTFLEFSSPPGWNSSVRGSLAGGGQSLGGGEVDTVVFDILDSGTSPVLNTVDAQINSVELNSGLSESDDTGGAGLETIDVQSPAVLAITDVTASRTRFTDGTNPVWMLTVDVQNNGGADIALALPGGTSVTFQDVSATPAVTAPSALEGGGATLSGGESDQLVFDITGAGSYLSFGIKNVTVSVAGTEVNTADPVSDDDFVPVTIDAAPFISYVDFSPQTVSKGAGVQFQVDVRDSVVNGAEVELDPAQTILSFAGGGFTAPLSAPVLVPGDGALRTLIFDSATIPDVDGNQEVTLQLRGTHNGVNYSRTIDLPDSVFVQNAPLLNIVSIQPSQPAVTESVQPPWTLIMTVENTGGTGVNLDLADGPTGLTLNTLVGGADVTNQYTIQNPTALQGGGTLLAGGQTGTLVFSVDATGGTLGTIVVSGLVSGNDAVSGDPINDNTLDGGTGSFVVQAPASIAIQSITTTRATVGAGQANPLTVKVAVRNDGGPSAAGADIDLGNSSIAFNPSTGWVVDPPTLAGGGTVIPGGATDTLLFDVTQAGTSLGVNTISATVNGTEVNRPAEPLFASATDIGQVTVQSAADVVITGVTPSRPSITAGSGTDVPWNIRIDVLNQGGASAELVLPDAGLVSVSGELGNTYAPVLGLEGGGVILGGGATGTIVVDVTSTGNFSAFGARPIDVNLDFEDVNTGVPDVATSTTGSIVVQTTPNLTFDLVDPDTVTTGSTVGFRAQVTNPGANAATARLDRALTRLSFNGYSASLDVSSPDSIPAGQSRFLQFNPRAITSATGLYSVNTELFYSHNGVSGSETETLTDVLEVQNPPQLSIQGASVSRNLVTAGMTASWTVTLTLLNSGTQPAPIRIDFDSDSTVVEFEFAGVPDGTYQIDPPTQLVGGGTDVPPNDSRDLQFTVTRTGDMTGVATLSGTVKGRDLNSGDILVADTFGLGATTVTVQTPAALEVLDVNTSGATVTAGQTTSWRARVVVTNTGQSSATLNLDPAKTLIDFEGGDPWVVVPPTELAGAGGTQLLGGSTDSLVFDVTQTGTAGTWGIAAGVRGTEDNSGREVSDTTDTSGSGTILVQTPPALRLVSTTIDAPSSPDVNTGQSFDVVARVTNDGEADATGVDMAIASSGGSTPDDPTPTIPSIPGGATVDFPIAVTAAGVAGPDTFTLDFDAALDANASESVTEFERDDSTAVANIESPASLSVDRVTPSQPSVTRGQGADWFVTVVVRNQGGADMDIDAPAPGDIAFEIGGVSQVDYVVQAPSALEGGGTLLAGGQADSLVYTIAQTGANIGAVDINATVSGVDLNDPASEPSAAGTGSVLVQDDVAGLRIATTLPTRNVFNRPSGNRAVVNTDQEFDVEVTVENTGVAVDSVTVSLVTNGNAGIALVSPDSVSIETGSSATFVFTVTADNSPNIEEELSASIDFAWSRNAQEELDPAPPIDATHLIRTETPADLSIGVAVTDPLNGGRVSPDQIFDVTASAANLGQAGVRGTLELQLDAPGFTLPDNDAVRATTVGQSVTWRVQAPPAPQAREILTASIVTVPTDVNNNLTAGVSQAADTVGVLVSEGGALDLPAIVISAPAGATDDVISTEQTITVLASVTPSEDAQDVVAEIVANGFQIVGNTTRALGDGDGTQKQATFTLIAPAAPAVDDTIRVTFTGTDVNTQEPLTPVSVFRAVTTVPRTRLSVSAAVVSPPDATDRSVSVGTPFTIEAIVNNALGAAGASTTGELTISIPAGYTLESGTNPQTATVGTPVEWQVKAPAAPSGPDVFDITITATPLDENSGNTAVVTTAQASIPMVTEGAAISALDVSGALGIDSKVVPAGARNVEMIGVELKYDNSDPQSSDARIDTISVAILGGDGRPLSDSAGAGTVRRVYIEIGGQTFETLSAGRNPVPISFVASPPTIAPGDSVVFRVGVDLTGDPAVEEIRLALGQPGFRIKDAGSGERLAVVDKVTGQALDGRLRSAPLVVLSNDFEEYVHNYPNPFRAGSEITRITYFLDNPGSVSMSIYSITGDLVYEETLGSGDPRASAGNHELEWDGLNMKGEIVRNGIYVCVLRAGSQSATFRIAVAK